MNGVVKASLQGIVGEDGYRDDPSLLERYGKGVGLVPDGRPVCVVRPRSAEQVSNIVHTARRYSLNLVPCSSGLPRSRGSGVPVGEGVIVDLSGMKGIRWISRRNRVAVIEPGVTFGELRDAAAREGLRVSMPLCPRADKSALAGYLEREPTTMPRYHWDSPDPLLTVEVVYGTGDRMRTGSSAGPGSPEDMRRFGSAHKNPLGPGPTNFLSFLSGAQGTMGIVTWGSVKLEILPRIRRSYFVVSSDIEPLIDATYEMTRKRLADELFLVNRRRFQSIVGSTAQSATIDPSSWILFFSVSGLTYAPEKRIAYQEREIDEILTVHDLEKTGVAGNITAEEFLRALEFRQPGGSQTFRAENGWNQLFFLTTLGEVPGHLAVMAGTLEAHGFPMLDMGVYVQPVDFGRSCHMEFTLASSVDEPEACARTKSLFLRSVDSLMDTGAFFSRPYGPVAEMVYRRCEDTVKALRLVKSVFDPSMIFNRGKLCFGEGEHEIVFG